MRTRIGFFDSGIGGISVMAAARRIMPGADYYYYADTDHVPYGTKTREDVIRYSSCAMDWMIGHEVDAIVIACNTATSMAAETLRRTYPIPIIGMEPAVKPAALRHPHEKVLVCATPLTIAGEKLHTLIDHSFTDEVQPDLIALPGLVELAERGEFDQADVVPYLEKTIDTTIPYAAIVLGCTHFTYFRDSFRTLFPEAELIDGTDGTVRRLISILTDNGRMPTDTTPGSITWSVSGHPLTDPARIAQYEMLAAR